MAAGWRLLCQLPGGCLAAAWRRQLGGCLVAGWRPIGDWPAADWRLVGGWLAAVRRLLGGWLAAAGRLPGGFLGGPWGLTTGNPGAGKLARLLVREWITGHLGIQAIAATVKLATCARLPGYLPDWQITGNAEFQDIKATEELVMCAGLPDCLITGNP